jgi:hypothetical protein
MPPHLTVATIDAAGTLISGVNGLLSVAAHFCRTATRVQFDYLLEGEPIPTKNPATFFARDVNSHLKRYSHEMLNYSSFYEIGVESEEDSDVIYKTLAVLKQPWQSF